MNNFLLRKKIGEKLRLCLLLLILPFCINTAQAKSDRLNERLLIEVLDEISRDHKMYFTYDADMIKGVTVDYEREEGENVRSLLSRLLAKVNMDFKIFEERFVIIYRQDQQGLKSLEEMIRHMETIVSDKKALAKVRKFRPVDRLETDDWIGLYQKRLVLNVTGRVIDANGDPLIGVNILVKGTSKGTTTDFDGQFILDDVDDQAVLVFSYIGYKTEEVPINGRTTLTVILQEDAQTLDEVVVTALGIKREEKSLGYAVQKVKGSVLQTAKEPNLLSNLTGKVAGLNIQNPPGLYEDPKISLRGSSNILVVVDNIPVETNFWNLSPDDIEEMSILKGPAAAALYGSRGQNGAILITTKKGGGSNGKVEVSINSSIMFQPGFVFMPETQNIYGSGEWGEYSFLDGEGGGTYDSDSYAWGPRLNQSDPNSASGFWETPQWDSPIDEGTGRRIPTPYTDRGRENIKNFFRTGNILSNNISLGARTETTNYRFSFTQLDQKGIDPNARIDATTIAFSGGHKFTDKFTVETSINYNKQYSENYPRTSYYSDNNMYNILVWMPSDVDVRNMKDYWITGQEGVVQRNFNYAYYNNPYFIANEYLQEYKKDVVYGFASLSYQFTPELKLTYRSNVNWNRRYRAEKRPKGFVGYSPDYRYGGFYPNNTYNFELNNEFLLTYDKNFNGNWTFNALVGGNNRNNDYQYLSISASQLSIPGLYNIGNSAVPITGSNTKSQKIINSLYGSTNIGYKNGLYLTLTGRNDWSSGMPVKNNSYFYPSVSLSGVLSEFVQMPDFITYSKLRAAWIRVGGDMSPYSSQATYSYGTIWGGTPTLYLGGTLYPEGIEPDFKNTIEFGGDFRLSDDRIGIDITYFEDTYSNMITTSSISVPSGFSSRLINSDKKTRTKGWEVTFRTTPIHTADFKWNVDLNWSRFRDFLIKAESGKEGRDGYVKEGGMYGNWIFRGEIDKTMDGKIIIKDGYPAISDGNTNFGFGAAKWTGGLGTNFQYKNWYLSLSFDGRWGGLLYSRLDQKLWESGKHILSADEEARDNDNNWRELGPSYIGDGVVVVSGEAKYDSDGFLISDTREYAPNEKAVYYRDWINANHNQSLYGPSIYDATFLKLRELVFSYKVPSRILENVFLKDIEISLIGRNLYLWTKEESNMDPDVKGGAGEARLYIPTPRNIGFNVKLKF